MKILILAANFFQTPYPVYPLGASLAAAIARRSGHDASLVDLLAESGFGEYKRGILAGIVRERRPDCVGISVRNAESTDSRNPNSQLDLIRDIVLELRGLTAAPVVLGGAGFTLLPQTFLRHTGADYGVAGEAEEAFPAFLAALETGRATPGLWNDGANSPAGTQESAAHCPNLARAYAERGGMIGIQTKRGCPLACLYCPYPLLEGGRVRARAAIDVIDDLRRLTEANGPAHVAFADSVFNDPGGSWRELLRAIIREKLPVSWTAFFQPFGLDGADLELVRESGAAGVEFGTDAASDATLLGLRKPFDFATVLEVQRVCAALRLPAAHYVIFGGPGETPAAVEEGLANLDKLERSVVFASSGLSVYPGTGLHRLAVAEGVVTPEEDFRNPVFYFSPGIDPEWLSTRLAAAFRRRRDRLYPPSAADEKTGVLRRMGYRGPLWDTLIQWPPAAKEGRA